MNDSSGLSTKLVYLYRFRNEHTYLNSICILSKDKQELEIPYATFDGAINDWQYGSCLSECWPKINKRICTFSTHSYLFPTITTLTRVIIQRSEHSNRNLYVLWAYCDGARGESISGDTDKNRNVWFSTFCLCFSTSEQNWKLFSMCGRTQIDDGVRGVCCRHETFTNMPQY